MMASRPGRWFRWLGLGLWFAACGGNSPNAPSDGGADATPDAEDTEPGSVELGSGETDFESVTDGQHLLLHAGTQGGHHVWLSYRTSGLAPEDVRMTLDVVPQPPARPAHSDVTLNLSARTDGAEGYEFIGWPAQILDPECAVGNEVSISLTITDKSGKQASGSMTVIPDPPQTGFTRACTR